MNEKELSNLKPLRTLEVYMNGNGHGEEETIDPDQVEIKAASNSEQMLIVAYQSLVRAYEETNKHKPNWSKVSALAALGSASLDFVGFCEFEEDGSGDDEEDDDDC